MPARRRKQSNAMLYTLITFVGLFIVATTIAVIYYVDAEDKKTKLADIQNQIDDLADSRERNALGTIVGTRASGKSWLGTMVKHLDITKSLIDGSVPEPTSAEAKINDVITKVSDANDSLSEMVKKYKTQQHIDIGDPNKDGLVPVIKDLTAELGNTIKAKLAIQNQLKDLEQKFANANKTNSEKEQILQSEKNKLQEQVNKIQADYNDLQVRLEQSTTEQVDTYRNQLEQAKTNLKSLNDKLLKTQAELKMSEDIMKRAQQEVRDIKPPPDQEILAHRADGKIILIDDQAKVVHLNIGSNQHVYRGLTFTVYDRSGPIPKDGKGKAEIEVYDVAETYSAARITRSEAKRPILDGDIVANLIWNSDKTNVFVVAGDFDLDNDGNFDSNAIGRIKALIEKWGGRVADTISIDTDFLVLGGLPQVPKQQPTFEELELDPGALQRYQTLLQRLNHYNQLQSQAQALWIPVFRYERFLYFIGYKGQISQAGAF